MIDSQKGLYDEITQAKFEMDDDMTENQGHPPEYRAKQFDCPHCTAVTGVSWSRPTQATNTTTGASANTWTAYSVCHLCKGTTIWHATTVRGNPQRLDEPTMIFPTIIELGPVPNNDLSSRVTAVFDEARRVLPISPRSACGLARLALQWFLEDGLKLNGTINAMISELVANQQVDIRISNAFDTVRCFGNDAAHDSEISDWHANNDMATHDAITMLEIVNEIADVMVTRPKRYSEKFDRIPEKKRQGIDDRNAAAQRT